MRRAALFAIFALACSTGAPPAPPKNGPAPTATASRAVLVSFDGLGADDYASRTAPAMARLAAAGTFVRRVIPVTPTSTSTAHLSILTGADPNVHGAIGNRFHRPGTPWTETSEGFTVDIDAQTLVESARRQGKRVGSIAFPSIDGRSERRSADFMIAYAPAETQPRIVHLRSADFRGEWVPPGWTMTPSRHPSFSPVVRARIDWGVPGTVRQDVLVAAYDTTSDGLRNYDSFLVESGGRETAPDAQGWFPVTSEQNGSRFGSWSKLLRADPSLDGVTFYWGAIHHNRGAPQSFVDAIDSEVGFWPGLPDERLAAAWLDGRDGIDPDTFAEQAERLSRFLTGATLLSIRRMPFDLLLAYQPMVDISLHQFLIVSDTQRNATPANRAAGQRVRDRAFAAADQAVGAMAAALDPARDALVVTGDHGLEPVDTEIRLGRLLADWGVGDDWAIYTSGNSALLYRINTRANVDSLIPRLEQTGWFERIDRRAARAHSNAPDVVLYGRPNIGLSPSRGELVAKPLHYGHHGGLNTHPAAHTTLIAWGAGIPRRTFDEMRQTEVARFVSRILGIEPPRMAD